VSSAARVSQLIGSEIVSAMHTEFVMFSTDGVTTLLHTCVECYHEDVKPINDNLS